MAYRDFTLKKALDDFGLTLVEADFTDTPESAVSQEIQNLLREYRPLAVAIDTEKARSEFLIAPILAEARRQAGHRFSLFSGVTFAVDPKRGLTGVCDYLLSLSPEQQFVRAPVFAIVEAKNDNLKRGLGQCVAEMVAAQVFNEREGRAQTIYGSVTSGTLWRFLKLEGKQVTLEEKEHYLDQLAGILGILTAWAN